ncbi:conserved membrane hypothetical protein [Gammaproteobacteria bacterium]
MKTPTEIKTSSFPNFGKNANFLVHHQLLGERLYLYSILRFMVALGMLAFTEFVPMEERAIFWFPWLALFLILCNTVNFLIVRPYRNLENAQNAYPFLVGMAHFTIGLDFVLLTVALWILGGIHSPFLPLYVLNLLISALLLSAWATIGHAVFSYALLASLAILEWFGIAPIPFLIYPNVIILIFYGILFFSAVLIVTEIVRLLRIGEKSLREANIEIHRLSNLRRDFLHIALHDLKSPVVASIQHIYNLKSGIGGPITDQQMHWLERAERRMNELSSLLHDLQVLASLESDQVRDHIQKTNIVEIAHTIIVEVEDLSKTRNHVLASEIPKSEIYVSASPRLIREAIYNLLTNAIKYTPDGGRIILRIYSTDENIHVEVEDNGIGISEEDQAQLFQEFVRIHHTEAVSKQPGSGLGLSIVRRIVEFHGGRVGVRSKAHEGSIFELVLLKCLP